MWNRVVIWRTAGPQRHDAPDTTCLPFSHTPDQPLCFIAWTKQSARPQSVTRRSVMDLMPMKGGMIQQCHQQTGNSITPLP